ncbi:type II toxin-antitoxin system HicA family toxin [Nocardia otitidiscaviarum]|uniref:type II toxin-antitoxin system HicA family toxin n=1 Tax=Nocardia otitidiscaviarum TaxID=1823 RepID=UPI0005BAAE12|nr:type II toxin-antitoxin system HicA family toxin [Nocardia otitidiscaviarum]
MTSQKEARELIARAQAVGWEYLGRSGSCHHRLRWPPTGQVLTVPSSPSFPLFNAESDLARISGPLRPKPGKGRSKAERAAARKRRENRRPSVAPPADASAPAPTWQDQLAHIKTRLEDQ